MKYKNPLAEHKTFLEKARAYITARNNGAIAYKSDDTDILLANAKFDDVEFVSGLWRVQDETNYKISLIRDKQMILGGRLPHQEKTFFEYYTAAPVVFNCYGILTPSFYKVVGKYVIDSGEKWSYGNNIAEARAYLGIKLYDEYMDLVHSVACKDTLKKKR